MTWSGALQLAETAAREAGRRLQRGRRREVLSERGKDIKLAADLASEQEILELLSRGSAHPILSEESGSQGAPGGEQPYWVVDPLDGTMNYRKGIPLCAVSIALWRGDDPLLGVIYDFNHKEMYTGIVGEGAWLNGQTITTSDVSDPGRAVLVTGFPLQRDYDADSLNGFITSVRAFKKVRLLGTAALAVAYVACGRVDAYHEEDIMLWDIAAGVALVAAAGGYVRVCPSEKGTWARHVYCASDGRLFGCPDPLT